MNRAVTYWKPNTIVVPVVGVRGTARYMGVGKNLSVATVDELSIIANVLTMDGGN